LPAALHTDPLSLSDADFLERATAMCATKIPHPNRQAATAHLRRGHYSGTPYHCPICGDWHTTTYNRAQSKRFSRRLSRLLRSDDPS
jgi:hypothetical protein